MGTKERWGTTLLAGAIALALASPAVAARPLDKPPKAGQTALTPLPAVEVAPTTTVETETATGTAAWSDESTADDVLADAAWSDAAWSDDSSVD